MAITVLPSYELKVPSTKFLYLQSHQNYSTSISENDYQLPRDETSSQAVPTCRKSSRFDNWKCIGIESGLIWIPQLRNGRCHRLKFESRPNQIPRAWSRHCRHFVIVNLAGIRFYGSEVVLRRRVELGNRVDQVLRPPKSWPSETLNWEAIPSGFYKSADARASVLRSETREPGLRIRFRGFEVLSTLAEASSPENCRCFHRVSARGLLQRCARGASLFANNESTLENLAVLPSASQPERKEPLIVAGWHSSRESESVV